MNALETLIALLALSAVVGWHELGHWLSARCLGFKTPVFSIGMGSLVLFSFYWQQTLFTFRALPVGGYVEIPEMTHDEESDTPLPAAWKRLIVISAGIGMNLLGAFLIFAIVMFIAGKPAVRIDGFTPTSTNIASGLQKGDVFESINGKQARSYEDILATVQQSQPNIVVTVRRGAETLSTTLHKDAENHIGILLAYASQPVSVPEAVSEAFSTTVSSFTLQYKFIASLVGLYKMPESYHVEVSGPIGITETLSKSLSVDPILFFLIIAQINVALAFANLVPIPPLDGGRFALVLIELCRQRPNPIIFEKVLMYAGGVLVLGLAVYTTWHDVVKWF